MSGCLGPPVAHCATLCSALCSPRPGVQASSLQLGAGSAVSQLWPAHLSLGQQMGKGRGVLLSPWVRPLHLHVRAHALTLVQPQNRQKARVPRTQPPETHNSLQTSGSSRRASALPERVQHVRSLSWLRKLPGREIAGQTSILDILSIVNTMLRGKGCSQPSVKSQKQSFGDNRFLATPHPGAQEGGAFRWLPGRPAQASA